MLPGDASSGADVAEGTSVINQVFNDANKLVSLRVIHVTSETSTLCLPE